MHHTNQIATIKCMIRIHYLCIHIVFNFIALLLFNRLTRISLIIVFIPWQFDWAQVCWKRLVFGRHSTMKRMY